MVQDDQQRQMLRRRFTTLLQDLDALLGGVGHAHDADGQVPRSGRAWQTLLATSTNYF